MEISEQKEKMLEISTVTELSESWINVQDQDTDPRQNKIDPKHKNTKRIQTKKVYEKINVSNK